MISKRGTYHSGKAFTLRSSDRVIVPLNSIVFFSTWCDKKTKRKRKVTHIRESYQNKPLGKQF